jgi:hypothetical protein
VHVGNSAAAPFETNTLETLVRVVNQQATALEEGFATKLTLSVEFPTLAMLMYVCCSEPRGMDWKVGLSEIVKSWTLTVTDMEWESTPL